VEAAGSWLQLGHERDGHTKSIIIKLSQVKCCAFFNNTSKPRDFALMLSPQKHPARHCVVHCRLSKCMDFCDCHGDLPLRWSNGGGAPTVRFMLLRGGGFGRFFIRAIAMT
jgi:hypothetical protein